MGYSLAISSTNSSKSVLHDAKFTQKISWAGRLILFRLHHCYERTQVEYLEGSSEEEIS